MMKKMSGTSLILAGAMLFTGGDAGLFAQEFQIIAETGDAPPDGDGVFSGFGENPSAIFNPLRAGPILNDRGEALFIANLSGTTNPFATAQVFRGDASGLTFISGRALPPAGAGQGFFVLADTSSQTMNDLGQVGFYDSTSFSREQDGIFRSDGVTTTTIIQNGQQVEIGEMDSLATFSITRNPSEGSTSFAMNEAGQVAFNAGFTLAAGGGSGSSGIFRYDQGALVEIVREGQATGVGTATIAGSFKNFNVAPINASGQVAFLTAVQPDSTDSSDIRTTLFVGDGNTLTQIVQQGQTVPGTTDTMAFIHPGTLSIPPLNDAGQTAWTALISEQALPAERIAAVYRGDGSTLTEIARAGQVTAQGTEVPSGVFFSSLVLNQRGQVAFFSTENLVDPNADAGIYRGDGASLDEIVRIGQAAPSTEGSTRGVIYSIDRTIDPAGGFDENWDFSGPAMNDKGQLAFLATVDLQDGGSPVDELGLFFYDDDLGLTSILRTGDAFDGGVVSDLFFTFTYARSTSGQQQQGSGLNNLGQVGFTYNLADGRSGVAVWTVPEPSSLALLGLGWLMAGRRLRGERRGVRPHQ
ncbi:MAG: choice-of-anchor tandem repeat NxxGxxAF-containing protein [Planctomycetota bacterium]